MDKVTLAEFWELLDKHDWYHEMSDDSRVDRAGEANWRKLRAIANQSSEHMELLIAFNAHMHSGQPWNNEQKPKPEKPVAESQNEK